MSSPRRASKTRPAAQTLEQRLENHTARLAVIGLGYVGLPLAVEMAQAGFEVVGIDIDEKRVKQLNQGQSYIQDVPTADVGELVREKRFPGTTDELVLPMLSESGLVVGKDFFLAFSPERVDPGNPTYNTRNIPKVVGGVTPACTNAAVKLYRQRLEHVVAVSSTQVAEMVKLLENTFRSVNIGLVNELALMCARLKIDVWEVIRAAATKPFGFMPFYPCPGLGGHCIPIDPFYLSWKARASGFEARFIELAGHVNGHMPDHVVALVLEALNRQGKSVRGSRVLVLGVAYKADVDDVRESPSLDIMEKLRERGARIEYTDPHVPSIEFAGG